MRLIVNGTDVDDGKIIGGVTFVPARVFAEALGAKVAWDGATKTVRADNRETFR
jgi:hypothetical protein